VKPRCSGSIYRRWRLWWLKYYDNGGRARRESSRLPVKSDAEKLLRARLGEVATGRRPWDRVLTFEDLARLITDDYAANGRRGQARLASGLKWLREYFAGWQASDIDYEALQAYRVKRAAAGVAPATIRWELGALRRAFNLAARAALAERPIFPSVTVSDARQGFFEREEWDAICQHLEPEFQDVGDFAYLTGWPIMDVLSLQWHRVTSGTLRLEPGTTKTGAGRNFPYADHPELAAVIARRAAKREELHADHPVRVHLPRVKSVSSRGRSFGARGLPAIVSFTAGMARGCGGCPARWPNPA